MKLYMVGMGISDIGSMPLRGLDAVKSSDVVFAEFFTSIIKDDAIRKLEAMSGKKVEVINRPQLEEEELVIGSLRQGKDVSLLTAGDPLAATTHQELRADAQDLGAEIEIVHSSSIFTAAPGLAGLQHYKFGRTTTIPFPEGSYLPTSPIEVIMANLSGGMHTLVLLDIQAHRERYMLASEGAEIILKMADKYGSETVGPKTEAVAIARAGSPDFKIAYCDLSSMKAQDMGAPPHSIIIPGRLHFMEEEMLERFRL